MVTTKSQNTKRHVDPLERNEESQNFFDQLFGARTDKSAERPSPLYSPNQEKPKPRIREEFSIFKRVDHEEGDVKPEKIRELQGIIKQELQALKKSTASFTTEINNIEKNVIGSSSEKVGIYHVTFLETLISMIKLLQVKVSEAGSWLQAINSKKAKRGSIASSQQKKAHDNMMYENKMHRSASQ